MTATYEALMASLEQSDKIYDLEKIRKAYEYADKCHQGQKR